MAQTGYTPILIYSSSTVSQAPAAGNLTNSTLGSELAINITDGKLFYKDNANNVQVIAWKTTPTTAGGTGLTSYAAGDLLYYATGTALSKLAIGANTNILTSTGTAPQWTAPSSITVGAATNLAGGVAGSVPYQSGAGTTTFLGIGAANTVLTSSGSAPQWSTSLNLAGDLTVDTNVLYANSTANEVCVGTTTSINVGKFNVKGDATHNGISVTPHSNTYYNYYGTNTAGTGTFYVNGNGFALFSGGVQSDGVSTFSANTTFNTSNIIFNTAAKGVNFTANTPAAGMTSQLLNWYETGTWTPTYVTSGTNFTSVTYNSATSGQYVRIGNLVFISCRIATDGITVGSASGELRVGGLPFPCNSAANAALSIAQAYNWASNTPIAAQVRTGATPTAELFYRTTVTGATSNNAYTDADTGASGKNQLFLAGCYYTA